MPNGVGLRIEPTGQARQQGRDYECCRFRAPRMDAERLDHRAALLQRANRAARARIEKVGDAPQRCEHHDPNEVIELALFLQREAK